MGLLQEDNTTELLRCCPVSSYICAFAGIAVVFVLVAAVPAELHWSSESRNHAGFSDKQQKCQAACPAIIHYPLR